MSSRSAIIERVTPIFREVFDDRSLVVTEQLDASQVPQWDSLAHISLVVALEDEFGIEFTTEELAEMETVGDLLRMLESKGA